MSGQSTLSVLVCTYNRRAVLAECLDRFEDQDAPTGSYELVVVDDGSDDGTADLLAARAWSVPATVRTRPNGGLAAARNTGLAAAGGDRVLLVNDDTIADRGLVRRHLEAGRGPDARLALLGTFEQPPDAQRTGLTRLLERRSYVFDFAGMTPGTVYDWRRFWTCNVSLPLDAARRVGGFDEGFRHYGCEDADLAYRVFGDGPAVRFDDRARAIHRHVLTPSAFRDRQRLVARAHVRLFAANPAALDHPEFGGLRHLTLETLERVVEQGAADLELADAAVARFGEVDLGPVDDPVLARRAEPVLDRLDELVRVSSTGWWNVGLAEGMREWGIEAMAQLRVRPRSTPPAPIRGPFLVEADWSGPGAAAHVAAEVRRLCSSGARQVLVRTDPGSGWDALRIEGLVHDVDAGPLGVVTPIDLPDGPTVELLATCTAVTVGSLAHPEREDAAPAGTGEADDGADAVDRLLDATALLVATGGAPDSVARLLAAVHSLTEEHFRDALIAVEARTPVALPIVVEQCATSESRCLALASALEDLGAPEEADAVRAHGRRLAGVG